MIEKLLKSSRALSHGTKIPNLRSPTSKRCVRLEADLSHLRLEYLFIAELEDILNGRSVSRENIVNSALADHILDLATTERILAAKTSVFFLGVSLHH